MNDQVIQDVSERNAYPITRSQSLPSSLRVTERTVEELAEVANLKLGKGRVRILAPILRQLLADLKKMDELDLGEEPLQLALRIRRGKQ